MEKTDLSKRKAWLLLAPTSVLYVITFLIPLATLFILSFAKFESSVTTVGLYLDNYQKILRILNTLKVYLESFH